MTHIMSGIATSPDDRHFTASAVVFNANGDVLLVHHKGTGLWQFPGGHVDPNEAPHETAIREVREETGIDIKITTPHELPGMRQFPTPFVVAEIPAQAWEANGEWPAEPAHHHIDFLYVADGLLDVPSEALTAQEDEVREARWFPQRWAFGMYADLRADVSEILYLISLSR